MNRPFPFLPPERHLQFQLFDPAEFAGQGFDDPLAGWPLADVRALAIDPDLGVRLAAAASRWNWDVRLQRVLGTDPDEQVVLALLNQVDPYVEVCELIIAGPHAVARCELARRNLRTELLRRLADDPDPIVAATATLTLTRRARLADGATDAIDRTRTVATTNDACSGSVMAAGPAAGRA